MQADDQAAPGATGWGEPFLRFDAAWQRLEARVCTGVLVAEIACLTLWVFLRGFATSFVPGQSAAGLLCRSMGSTATLGGLGAAVVCGVAVCGFVDYIAIAAYQVNANQPCPTDSTKECDTPVGEKLAVVGKETAADFFVLGRQASLDLRT